MTDQRITALEEALPRMTDEHQTFARALLGQLELRNSLTAREWFWVSELVRRYPPPKVYQLDGNLGPMVAMMVMASTKLLEPHVRLLTPKGQSIHLKMDSQRGSVNVQFPGGFAKITGDGFLVSPVAIDVDVVATLSSFAKDPMQAAAAYARRTGRCCFCYVKLEDERSVRVGYGPVCAQKYNLPFPKDRTPEGMLAKLEKL